MHLFKELAYPEDTKFQFKKKSNGFGFIYQITESNLSNKILSRHQDHSVLLYHTSGSLLWQQGLFVKGFFFWQIAVKQ